MELHTVGILSPGDMGHAMGRVLGQRGLRVLTRVQGRSARTATLAATAGMTAVEDDETLVREAEIVLSRRQKPHDSSQGLVSSLHFNSPSRGARRCFRFAGRYIVRHP